MRGQKLAVATVWMAAAALGPAQPLAISVQVVDNYGAPKSVTSEAQKDAAHILAVAGVRLDWQPGSTPGGLTLYLVARRTVPTHCDALGYALIAPASGGGCNCGYLLYPAIERNAWIWKAGVPTVLGVAMAHEIGHILFNSTAHSSSGIMIASFGYGQITKARQGGLLFTAEQAAYVRSQVALRSSSGTRRAAAEEAP